MKETGGPNLQCFRRKTTLKITLSRTSKSYLQQAFILQEYINTTAGFSATALPKLPWAVQSPVQAHKAEATSQPPQAAVVLCGQHATEALFCYSRRRKETRLHARSGLVVMAALARQAGSVVISKMCLRRQINYKADCRPPKLTGMGSRGTRPHTVYGTSVVQGQVFRKAT